MEDNYEDFIKYTESDDFMTDEEMDKEMQKVLDAYYEEERKQRLKMLADYRKYKKNALSYMPADYYREEAENMMNLWSYGFVEVEETTQYNKTYYKLTESSVKEAFGDSIQQYLTLKTQEETWDEWFESVDKLPIHIKEIYDKWIENGQFGDNVETYDDSDEVQITHTMTILIRQFNSYEDDYHGYIALPMKDGRYWLIGYSC